jgi:NitT/TauT family transport system substrate-binding protein
MQIVQTRRRFLAGLSATAVAGSLGRRSSIAAEPPPETTTIRLAFNATICFAPFQVAGELLRAEGFTDVQYVRTGGGFTAPQMIARGDMDFGASWGGTIVYYLDAGLPITAVGGLHPGCYELFAHEPVRTVGDLKGRRVSIQTLAGSGHLYLSIMAKYVGLDPKEDIEWVVPDPHGDTMGLGDAMKLFTERQTDAFLAFPPEPQELRARRIGRVIVNTITDKPWSQYFCCMLYGNRHWVRQHPIATKRFLRAVFKAADFCSAEPRQAAQLLVDGGFAENYNYALQTVEEVPYQYWYEYDSEDSLRFYALRLHEGGMIKSSPNALLAEGTDWRFVNELKRELKA